jgi:hypothetical protein
MSEDRVVFLRPDAERIANAVRAFESGERDEQPLRFRRVESQRTTRAVRYVDWASNWSTGQSQTITFRENGQTALAINVFAGVDPGSGWVARHSGTWHLIVCNLTTQQGYSEGSPQILGHAPGGLLKWFDVTECP